MHLLCMPLLWPTCKNRASSNPQFRLIEDHPFSSDSEFTNHQQGKFEVEKVDWPSNSSNFNPIEQI